MAEHFTSFSPLLEAMDAGSLVLTPNHRTHIQLLDFYGQWRKSQGLLPVCKTPEIYPIDIWIRQQWQTLEAGDDEVKFNILEPVLESSLWQNIIQHSDAGANLVNKSATARSVQEAWRLIHIWKIDLDDIRQLNHFQKSSNNLDDLAAFLSWVDSFEQFCLQKTVISLSPLVAQIIEKIAAQQLVIPDKILLTGFQNPPPLYAEFIDVLGSNASSVEHFPSPTFEPAVSTLPCMNAEDEIVKSAQWARQVLAESPDAKIAIVCQDLKQRASSLHRAFNNVFNENPVVTDCNGKRPVFSVSSQRPLPEVALIESALGILNLNASWVDTLAFCKLLRSPFVLNMQDNELAKSSLEFSLRKKGELKTRLSQVRELLEKKGAPEHSDTISSCLLELDTIRRNASSKASCRQWSDVFETQLNTLSWPGNDHLDYAETEQLNSWSKALRLFKQTSHWHGQVSLEFALSHLKQIIASYTVSAANDSTSVQVVSPTEAEGVLFSHTWVMGLSEQHWPPSSRPSPFIPLGLQKKAELPESNIVLMTELARQQLQQFRNNSSVQIIFSYPCQDDDLSLKPAAMLDTVNSDLPHAERKDTQSNIHPAVIRMMQQDDCELFTDSNTIPLLKNEVTKGGISLIANQADCPFKAFAIHRLDALQFPAPVIGLPANILGSLLHEVMENFWQLMKDQQNLLDSSKQELAQIIGKTVSEAIQKKARQYPYTMTERFIALENRRLGALLANWLEEERKRGSFKVLKSEAGLEWKHADLVLKIRIDRIDELPDGSVAVIDYKSAKNSEIKWLEERQTNPQLMLYMQAVEAGQQKNVAGLFIAQINIEDSRYKGISNDDSIYPKSLFSSKTGIAADTSWEDISQSWQESLADTANQYLQGFAAVDPVNTSSSCTWCHLGGLCRIKEELPS